MFLHWSFDRLQYTPVSVCWKQHLLHHNNIGDHLLQSIFSASSIFLKSIKSNLMFTWCSTVSEQSSKFTDLITCHTAGSMRGTETCAALGGVLTPVVFLPVVFLPVVLRPVVLRPVFDVEAAGSSCTSSETWPSNHFLYSLAATPPSLNWVYLK